jgi:hypothetical protein
VEQLPREIHGRALSETKEREAAAGDFRRLSVSFVHHTAPYIDGSREQDLGTMSDSIANQSGVQS